MLSIYQSTYIVSSWLLRWLDQYDRVIGTSGSKWVKDTTTLVFENPQEKDAGNYTFVANNTWGERSQEVWVEVSGELFAAICIQE